MVFLSGKTVNSYRRNHNIMGMLPIPPKAVERGFAPPDLFPHKSSAKNPVHSNRVSHQKQTPYPPNLQNRDHEFKAPLFLWPCSRRYGRQVETGIRITRGDIYNVYVRWWSPPVLCNWRYDHHFRLGAGSTIRQRVMIK
jgi:hypothetical protein